MDFASQAFCTQQKKGLKDIAWSSDQAEDSTMMKEVRGPLRMYVCVARAGLFVDLYRDKANLLPNHQAFE